MDWTRFPKVELHLHLDCSLSYGVVSRIDPSIALEQYRMDFVAPAKCDVIDDHLAAFQYARDKGIPYTAHAGESRGADNVWDTVQHFMPARLGHGVPCLERPALVEHLRRHQIHLELCPTSNVQTNTFDTYADHPIDKLYQAGLSVGVNTDARTISNITLSQEYAKLHEAFGWDTEEFFNCNRNALQAAFIPDDVRDRLMVHLADGYRHAL
jgi:adenosine deaminase